MFEGIGTVAEFVESRGVTVDIVDGPTLATDSDGWRHHAYRVALNYDGRRLETDWRAGLGITDTPDDTPAEVFDALLSDAAAGRDTFEDFASEYGYDSDSRRAFALWESCVELSGRFVELVGGEDVFDALCGLERA